MTADPAGRLAELEALREAATPGPWEYDPSEGDTVWDADEKWPSIIALTRDPYGHCEADAALIVAAVNALPELIAAERERDALRDAVLALADEMASDRWGTPGDAYLYAANRIRAAVASALDRGTE